MFENCSVGGTAFSPAQNIDEDHPKITSCEDVLPNEALLIPVSSHEVRKNPGMEMGSVNGAPSIAEVRIELRIFSGDISSAGRWTCF
jgi:hypothetical protein